MAKKGKILSRIRPRISSPISSVRLLSPSSNALAPFRVALIFKKNKHTRRLEPYTMERKLERLAKPPRFNNWLNPFRSVCADRKERRSVLFATKKAGFGKKIHTPKTYSIRSSVKCKG